MFEIQLRSLLEMAAGAQSIQSCQDYILRLNSMKRNIQAIPAGLNEINQMNAIDKLKGRLVRRIRDLDAAQEFRKRDKIKAEASRKDDKYRVKPLVNETIARQSYRK